MSPENDMYEMQLGALEKMQEHISQAWGASSSLNRVLEVHEKDLALRALSRSIEERAENLQSDINSLKELWSREQDKKAGFRK